MRAFEFNEISSGTGDVLVVMPGILARSREQVAPLLPTFRKYNLQVEGMDYIGDWFNYQQYTYFLEERLAAYYRLGRRCIVLGLSIGGMLTASTMASGAMNLGYSTPVIIADSPAGEKDLVMGPSFVNGLAAQLFARHTPSPRANDGYGAWLLKKFAQPPKDDAIEVPDAEFMRAWHGRDFSPEQWKLMVRQWATQGLSGHKFTMWWGQLQYMLGIDEVIMEGISHLPSIYLENTRANVTVRQPQAADKWRASMSEVIEVPTAHCGILEACVTWNTVMDDVLSRL